MGAAYVLIDPHSRPEFPNMCPFTGAPNPRKWVAVRKTRGRWVLPIPFLGFVSGSEVVRFRLPASPFTAMADKVLARIGTITAVLLGLGYFIGRFVFLASASTPAQAPHQPRPYDPPEGGISWLTLALVVVGTYIVARILRRVNVHAVRIVALEHQAMELCFSREDYAKAFCALNNLTCHSEPVWKRREMRQRKYD